MTQEQLAIDLINWGVDVAFLVPFLFPAYIRLIWAWEKDEWGWNIILLDLAVSLAILPTFVHRVAGVRFSTPVFLWLEAASLWFIPMIIVWRSVMIWRKQRRR
jgi:hypothetical protein